MNWTVVAAIAAGGAAGSVARHAITVFFQRMYSTEFPWWTLSINVIGSFVLGVIVTTCALRWPIGHLGQAFLMVGLLGGFTTFSAFGNETLALLRAGEGGPAAANVLANVLLAIGAVWVGRLVAQTVVSG